MMKKRIPSFPSRAWYVLMGFFVSLPILSFGQAYNTTLSQQCNQVVGGQETMTFSGTLPNAIGDATLTIVYRGDLDGTGGNLENLTFSGETGGPLGTTPSLTPQCTGIGTFTTTIPMATVNAWAATGNIIEILADASPNVDVNVTNCLNGASFCVTGTLEYPVATTPNDAGVSALESPAASFCNSTQTIEIRVNNFGTNQINSVDVNWSANGALQTPVSISSTLDTATGTGPSDTLLNLGTWNFSGFDTLRFWTSNPNGTTDGTPINDTLEVILGPGLSGTYTLGTPTSDFPDFATFVSTANALQLCGPTIVNVAAGTYNETVELTAAINSSATNTLLIRGAGVGTSILTSATSTASGNAVVHMNGADYVTFSNMTIRNTGFGADKWGFLFRNSADHNTIDSCEVAVPITTSTDVVGIVTTSSTTSVTGEDDNANYLTVSNSRITGGHRNIHLEGDNGVTNRNRGHRIWNNVLLYADDFGISGDEIDSLSIRGNIIDSLTSTVAHGIELIDFNDFEIVGNYINSRDQGMELDDANFDYTPVGRAVIANNMIIGLDDGINIDDMEDTDIFHNSVLGEPGVAGNDLTNLDVRNNIFMSRNTFSVDMADATPIGTVDYNVYHTVNGTVLAQYGTQNLQDLAAIIAADPTANQNSLEGDPGFISGTDLHIIGVLPGDVGDNSVGITVDIDGDVRPLAPSTTVDIGADEYTTPADDAAMVEVESPGFPFCAGDSAVVVSFQNTGTDSLFSADLTFTVNGGAPTTQSWNGALEPGGIATGVTIANHTGPFSTGDIIVAWTSNPNGVADVRPLFDTTSSQVRIGLSGTFVIDGTAAATGDFATFQEALDSLGVVGVCGPVIFDVIDTTYEEQLVLTEYIGASAVNTVTFRSQSGDSTGVILEWNNLSTATNYVVDFNGADHYRFQQMTIRAIGAGTVKRVLQFRQNADSNRIEHCVVEGVPIISTSTNYAVIYSINDQDHGNYFGHNVIRNGSNGFHWFGVSTTVLEEGTVIEYNQMLDQYAFAMTINEQRAPVIRGNYITSNSVNTGTTYGIDVDDCRGPSVIDNNHIVSDINLEFPTYGLHIEDTEGTFNQPLTITNNRVLVSDAGTTVYGMDIDDVEFVRVENNSIVVGDGGNSSRALWVQSTTVVAFVYNNIFANLGTGYSVFQTAGSISDANNNLYYTNGNILANSSGDLGSLITWQNSTGFDANSMQLDPQFSDSIEMVVCLDTLDGTGTPTGFVTEDYEGDMRDANAPDIGADEFTSLSKFTLGDDVVLCDGDTLEFEANGFDNVLWNGISSGNTFTTFTTGAVFVEVNNSCGTTTDTVTVFAQEQPVLPNASSICVNGTVTLDPGIPNGTYQWNNTSSDTTQTITVNTPGTYRVNIVDAFGCASVDSTVVSLAPVVDLPDTTDLCEGGAALLDAGIPGAYVWGPNNQNSQTIQVTAPGVYSVTVTDNSNCVSEDSTEVVLVPFPQAGFTTNTSALAVSFTSTSSNATGYDWDFGDGNSSTQASPTHIYAWPGGTFTVTLTVSNQCGTDDSTIVITVDDIVGVDELNEANGLSIYPVPADGSFFVQFEQAPAEEVELQLVDLSGKVFLQQTVNWTSDAPVQVEAGALAPGVYLLQLNSESMQRVERIILR